MMTWWHTATDGTVTQRSGQTWTKSAIGGTWTIPDHPHPSDQFPLIHVGADNTSFSRDPLTTLAAAVAKSATGSPSLADIVREAEFLYKVGPKGYVHGWIFVGAPGVGHDIHHPQFGRGKVRRKTPKRTHIEFGDGTIRSFEHGEETPDKTEHFVARPSKTKPAPKKPTTRGPGGKKMTADEHIKQAYADLYAGKHTSIPSRHLDGLMRSLTGQDPNGNLSMVNVDGYPNLYQRHLRDIPRDQMPQMGTEIDHLHQFISDLTKRGVEMHIGEVDPTKLVATQSQLSGPKVAKLYGFMASGGWLPGGVMLVSTERDGSSAVVDGHHRWAAAAAVRASGARPKMNVTALRIGMPIDDILDMLRDAPKESLATDREAR